MVISDKLSTKKEEQKKKGWIDLIDESVHTSDDVEISATLTL
jgi:hypothetical protein